MALTDNGAATKTETLGDQVYRQLLNAIKVGEFAGQARLPSEADMAAHFKVSRPVLRQALERLRASGIVTSKRGSGNFVVETVEPSFAFDPLLSIPDVQRCLEFRCAVEAKAAGTAARKRTKLQLEVIERALHDFRVRRREPPACSGGRHRVPHGDRRRDQQSVLRPDAEGAPDSTSALASNSSRAFRRAQAPRD